MVSHGGTRGCAGFPVPKDTSGAIEQFRPSWVDTVDVIDVLSDLFIARGVPAHIRSDNGPEFVAKAVREWIAAVGAKTAYIAPGSPWENGYIESFNARLRDERLDGEIFLLSEGGSDRDRELAMSLQCYPPTRVPWLSATGP